MYKKKNCQTGMKKYGQEFGGAMIGYIGILIAVVATRPEGTSHVGIARIIEILPAIPLIFAFWAIIRQFNRGDEFYKRIHAEAFALGALTWGLFIMIWGFAENAGAPVLPTMFIAPGLIALWGLSLPIIMRRYK